MLEVDLTYDLSPNYDMASYGEWAQSSSGIIKNQPGVVAFRGHRNVFGTPRIRTTSVWRCPEDWDRFTKSTDWLLMKEELNSFASDLTVSLRGAEKLPESSARL
jgi:hypothetical protein